MNTKFKDIYQGVHTFLQNQNILNINKIVACGSERIPNVPNGLYMNFCTRDKMYSITKHDFEKQRIHCSARGLNNNKSR